MKRVLCILTILLVGNISAEAQSPDCDCDYTINSWYWKFDGMDVGNLRNVTIHDPIVAGNHPLSNVGNNPQLSLKEGDVICVDASVPYRFMTWKNISGTVDHPVIIKNIGGQVVIKSLTASYGWMFKNSKHFKILGNGDARYKYGFKVTTHHNSYMKMIDKTTDFEIAYVEIAGDYPGGTHANSGFAGIMAKSQPICWDNPNGGSTDAGNFEMKNVSIHDNYIHDVGGEGMYVGYGKSQGVTLNASPGVPCSRMNYPHHVRDLYIYNNIIENVGWDGIQVKNAHYNAQIYNNVIKNYATLGVGAHDEGLFVGDGSEALIYGNWIEKGNTKSNGMQINAFGNTKIYNNVVLGAGFNGLYLNNQSHQFANRVGTFEIYNNTIEGGTNSAIVTHTPQDVIIKNNIGFGYQGYHGIKNPVHGLASSNIIERNTSDAGFVDYTKGDIQLIAGANGIDTGDNDPSFYPYDFTATLRADALRDIGAIEYGTNLNNADLNISITSPTSSTVLVPTGAAIPIKATLTDANNKVRKVQYYLNNRLIGTDFMPSKTEHVIGNQHFTQGVNVFNIKVTLYGGHYFYSNSINLINNPTPSARPVEKVEEGLEYYYDSSAKELVVNGLDDVEVNDIEIYDLLGRRFHYWDNVNKQYEGIRVSVNDLPVGVYVVKIRTEKGISSKKIFFL